MSRFAELDPIRPEGNEDSVWLGILAIRGIQNTLSSNEAGGILTFMGFSSVGVVDSRIDPLTDAFELTVSAKGRKDIAAEEMVKALRESVAFANLQESTQFLGMSIADARTAFDDPSVLYARPNQYDDIGRHMYDQTDAAQAA